MYKIDSRKIKKGDTFICLPGGEPFIEQAKNNGAVAVKKMSRQAMGQFFKTYYNDPSSKLKVVGVTGTNGKTSVTHYVHNALLELGHKSYVLGTLNSSLTTPESIDSLCLMNEHLKQSGEYFVMEVSSHAIKQQRIAGITFQVACLTNITQDHLDYHKTFEEYKQTKLEFMAGVNGTKIFPKDFSEQIIPGSGRLEGTFNKKNLQATKSILLSLGFEPNRIDKVLSTLRPPPGRFEYVEGSQPFDVIIDYAHTPDGLNNVLNAARKQLKNKENKVLCLFGCGGDRDRQKRPLMAKEVCSLADTVVITQDNPRTEDKDQIIDDILKGVPKLFKAYFILHDREAAIHKILSLAKSGDVVVIAGKGHEKYQIIDHKKINFDDKKKVQDSLEKRGY